MPAVNDRRYRLRSSGDRRAHPRPANLAPAYARRQVYGRCSRILPAAIVAGIVAVAVLCAIALTAPAAAQAADDGAYRVAGTLPAGDGAEYYISCNRRGSARRGTWTDIDARLNGRRMRQIYGALTIAFVRAGVRVSVRQVSDTTVIVRRTRGRAAVRIILYCDRRA